jgi:hypothetical protein
MRSRCTRAKSEAIQYVIETRNPSDIIFQAELVVPIERGIEDDPDGSTSEIQNGKGRFLPGHLWSPEGIAIEEVVSGDSSKDPFILSIHGRHVLA